MRPSGRSKDEEEAAPRRERVEVVSSWGEALRSMRERVEAREGASEAAATADGAGVGVGSDMVVMVVMVGGEER